MRNIFYLFFIIISLSTTTMSQAKDRMLLELKYGTVEIELFNDVAPNHVKRFKELASSGKYNNVVFHRVIDGFMIQGGGFTVDMNQKTAKDTVENEANNGLKNDSGTISMARTMDPHSASSQFFINVNDNNFLNYPGQDGWGYCVFGKVIEGMDIVNKIKEVNTKNMGPHQNVPVDPIIIQSIELVEQG